RYTVYTPQEEMKQILLEDKDYRLDTIRKIFGIDKYKRIKENSKILSISLREKIKELEGSILDLSEKESDLKKNNNELNNNKEELSKLQPKLQEITSKIKEQKKEIEKAEKDNELLKDLENKLNLNLVEIKNKTEGHSENIQELKELNNSIESLKKELNENNLENLEDVIKIKKETQDQINLIETSLREITKKVQRMNINKENSENVISKITKLDECPTCLQKVDTEHKKSIIQKENITIQEVKNELSTYENQEKEAESKIKELKEKLENLTQKEKNYEILRFKQDSLKEKQQRYDKIKEFLDNLQKDIENLKKERTKSEENLNKIPKTDFPKLKIKLDYSLEEEKLLNVKKISIETNINNLKQQIEYLSVEIEKKQESKKTIENLNNIQRFIQQEFIELINLIEKRILSKVYHDFNSLFEKWLSTLIDDESFSAKLDEEFSPKITQNGYDTNYLYLSGGEKTAIALAYRLALNQVINNIISHINTKDLIILDEPTDGFSEEQLDKIKPVLDELDIKQILIVSHESKIESFVSNIIRCEKKEGTTNIIQ
ncbi:hypothetical protein K8R47_01750, partial [archaeon]|nr:hypothetical protein [archaeon]